MMLDGWQDLSLSDLATIVGGGTPSRRYPAYWNGDVPWATPTDVTGLGGRVISETASTITDEGLANSSAALLPPCSLLMTTRATIGACAINRISMATNQGFQSLVPKQSTCVEFLYYLIQHHKRRLERLAAGSTFLEVSKRAIRSFRVVVPPLPEQRKIVAILSSVDDAIEKTQTVIDQVQVVKRGLMQELLTRGLPGRNTRFKRTEIGEIPDDWRIVRIAQIGIVEAGRQRSPRAQGKPRPYLRVANVYDGHIDTTSLFSMPFRESEFLRYKLVTGDLLLNEGQSRELVGRCAQYSGDPRDCCFQNTLIRFRAGKYINPRFAFWVFRYYFYSGVFSSIARQTTSVAHLGVQRFANLKIALPSLAEQVKITEKIEAVNSCEIIERDWLGQLQAAKTTLMSILLTGELRVSPDPETA